MKIGFTGTQEGMTELQRNVLMTLFQREEFTEFHHGDCVGADAEAHELWSQVKGGVAGVVIHPPDDPKKRAFCNAPVKRYELPYLMRNKEIVLGVSLMLATPKGREPRGTRAGGTWFTIRYARKVGMPLVVIYPDGTYEREDA